MNENNLWLERWKNKETAAGESNWSSVRYLRKEDFPMVQKLPQWI